MKMVKVIAIAALMGLMTGCQEPPVKASQATPSGTVKMFIMALSSHNAKKMCAVVDKESQKAMESAGGCEEMMTDVIKSGGKKYHVSDMKSLQFKETKKGSKAIVTVQGQNFLVRNTDKRWYVDIRAMSGDEKANPGSYPKHKE